MTVKPSIGTFVDPCPMCFEGTVTYVYAATKTGGKEYRIHHHQCDKCLASFWHDGSGLCITSDNTIYEKVMVVEANDNIEEITIEWSL